MAEGVQHLDEFLAANFMVDMDGQAQCQWRLDSLGASNDVVA